MSQNKMKDREDKSYKNPKGYKGGKGKGKGKYEPKPKDNGDINDSSFYYLDPTLRDQIMNFSMNSFNGIQETIPNISATGVLTTTPYQFVNASVCAIQLMPTVTPPLNPVAPTDGINLVGVRNFTVLSANNAKTTNYSPQDVTMLMLALQELLKTISHFTRMFGLLYLYNQRNRSWPDKFFELMHLDADDFRKNAADYRIRFNALITTAQKIPFFSNYGAFAKASEIFSTVYVDSDSPMAQTYFFMPESTWLFDEAYDSNGSGLRTWMKYTTTQTFSQMLDDLDTMISALLTSTTLNFIYSDVLRLLNEGKGTPLTFALVPDFYQVNFMLNKEVESYIQGIRYWDRPNYVDTAAGFQDYNDVKSSVVSNSIDYNPTWRYPSTNQIRLYANLFSHGYVNFDTANPSIEDKVNVTRLAARSKWVLNSTDSVVETSGCAFGDYYVTKITIASIYDGGLGMTDSTINQSIDLLTSTNYAVKMSNVCAWGKFKYQPKYSIVQDQTSFLLPVAETGEFNFYTDLDYEFMRRMFDAEMIGEYSLRV